MLAPYTAGRILTLAVVLSLFASACQTSQRVSSESALIRAKSGGRVQLDAASLEVPPGGLSRDSKVGITDRGREQVKESDGVILLTSAYDLDVDSAKLTKPATVHFAIPPAVDESAKVGYSLTLAYFEPSSKQWIVEPSVVDWSTRSAKADVNHLSLWSLAFSVTEWARTQVGRFLGARATPPQCDSQLFGGLVGIEKPQPPFGVDEPLLMCSESQASGRGRVKVVNNRPYMFRIQPASGLGQMGTAGFGGSLYAEVVVKHLQDRRAGLLLPAGGSVEYEVSDGVQATSFSYEADFGATAVHLFLGAVGQFVDAAEPFMAEVAECSSRVGDTDSIAAGLAVVLQCADALEPTLVIGGVRMVGTATKHIFGALVDVVVNDFVTDKVTGLKTGTVRISYQRLPEVISPTLTPPPSTTPPPPPARPATRAAAPPAKPAPARAPTPTPAPPRVAPQPAPPPSVALRVFARGEQGYNQDYATKRSGPCWSQCSDMGHVPNNGIVNAVCWVQGEDIRPVNPSGYSNTHWYRLTDGTYMTDSTLATQNNATPDPRVPRC